VKIELTMEEMTRLVSESVVQKFAPAVKTMVGEGGHFDLRWLLTDDKTGVRGATITIKNYGAKEAAPAPQPDGGKP
jgi:hypothetical protein